jgi:hypothetical protein
MIKLTDLLKEALTEVSVEQLKTQFVDSGKISQKDFNEIINVTSKTAYITWLAKKVADKIIKAEDIYKFKKYFSVFDRNKKEYPFADINQYKTQDDLSRFISKSVDITDKESEDVSQQKGVSKTDKYKEFYIGSVDGFNVYELPKDRTDLYGASCELGSGTGWCTATGKRRNEFDYYISQGPLFTFIKPGDKEKYQFNYETDSFMDKKNNRIAINKEMYPLFKFIEDKNPEYKMPLELKFIAKDSKSFTNEDLNVKGDLNFEGFKLTSLPGNLTVEGNLRLAGTPITTLPKGLTVKKNLFLNFSNVTYIPKDLTADTVNVMGNPFYHSILKKFGTYGEYADDKFPQVLQLLKTEYPGVKEWK